MLFYGIELASGTTAQNLTVEGSGVLPTTNLHGGRLYFNSAAKVLELYDGTGWVHVGGGGGVTSWNGRTGAVTFTAADVDAVINDVNLPIASAVKLGAIKVGTGLAISGSGVLSATGGGGGTAGVTSFNGRAADVVLTALDVTNVWPKATAGTLGVIRIGSGLTIDGIGVVSATATNYTLPTATAGTLGGVRVGTGLAIDGSGILSATGGGGGGVAGVETFNGRAGVVTLLTGDVTAVWPKATTGAVGVVRVGTGLSIDVNGILSSNATAYNLPVATGSVLGGVKVGSGLSIDGSGILSAVADTPYSLPTASATVLGGVKVGSGLSITGGVLSATGGGGTAGVTSFNTRTGAVTLTSTDVTNVWPTASASVLGVIKVGSRLTISGGVLSADIQSSSSFPSGTGMLFLQNSAPTGWHQTPSDYTDNRMIRIVNSGGGGIGGSDSPTLMDKVPAHTHTFTTGNESANHTHSYSLPDGTSGGGDAYSSTFVSTGNYGRNTAGQSSSHTHSVTTANNGGATTWSPRYLNVIGCAKD